MLFHLVAVPHPGASSLHAVAHSPATGLVVLAEARLHLAVPGREGLQLLASSAPISQGAPPQPVRQLLLLDASPGRQLVLAVFSLCAGRVRLHGARIRASSSSAASTPGISSSSLRPGQEYELVELSLPQLSTKLRNAVVTCICLNQRGPPDWMLCVGTATKKLLLFTVAFPHVAATPVELIPYKEIIHNQTPSAIVWYENVLCVGSKASCSIIEEAGGNIRSSDIPVTIDPEHGPLILALPGGRLLVSSILSMGVIINLSGLPVGGSLLWSSRPIALSYSRPYVVSLLENGTIEILSIPAPSSSSLESGMESQEQTKIVQTCSVPGGLVLSDSILLGEELFAAISGDENDKNNMFLFENENGNSSSSGALQYGDKKTLFILTRKTTQQDAGVFALAPISWSEQVHVLLDDGKVDEALELLQLSMQGARPERCQAAIHQFHLDAGARLLRRGDNFARALRHLLQFGIDPREVLVYIPNLHEIVYRCNFLTKTFLFRGLSRLSDLYAPILENLIIDTGPVSKSSMYDALISFVEECRLQIRSNLLVTVTSPFLSEKRNQQQQEENGEWKHDPSVLEILETDLLRLCVNALAIRRSANVPGLSIYEKCFTLAQDPDNRVIVSEEVIAVLEKEAMFHVLARLYATHSRAKDALVLWSRLGTGQVKDSFVAGSQERGVKEACSFLKQHDVDEEIWEHSVWIVRDFPDQALTIFTERPKGNVLSPDLVLGHFSKSARNQITSHLLRVQYMDWLFQTHSGTTKDPEGENSSLATRLAVEYIDLLKALQSDGKNSPWSLEDTRKRFRVFLEHVSEENTNEPSRKLDAQAISNILAQPSSSWLVLERVTVHGILGQDEEAIHLLVHVLKSYEASEEYCIQRNRRRVMQNGTEKNPCLLLLQIYLSDELGSTGKDLAIRFLTNHASEIPPIEVLKVLPENFALHQLGGYFEKTFRRMIHTQHTQKITRRLEGNINLLAKTELLREQSKYVIISTNTRCANCGRLILDKVFQVEGGERITHGSCE